MLITNKTTVTDRTEAEENRCEPHLRQLYQQTIHVVSQIQLLLAENRGSFHTSPAVIQPFSVRIPNSVTVFMRRLR